MLYPKLVFPTPGGPERQIILPFLLPFNCFTAKNSKIRYFIFDRPKWSVSKTF